MPSGFSNPIIEAAVMGGRQSLDVHLKLEQVQQRCDMNEEDLLKHYGGVNPYDSKALERHNHLVSLVEALDQDEVDMGRLRKLLFSGVPVQGEKFYYRESELTPSNVTMSEQLSYALRGLSWRIMLGVYGT